MFSCEHTSSVKIAFSYLGSLKTIFGCAYKSALIFFRDENHHERSGFMSIKFYGAVQKRAFFCYACTDCNTIAQWVLYFKKIF